MRFLSTPSARRATAGGLCRAGKSADFYPRPPRGGRPGQLLGLLPGHDFYPRPPRGGRLFQSSQLGVQVKFLSTPSARRATSGLFTLMFGAGFLSTPSARRATKPAKSGGKRPGNFYPRPPRGGRPLNRRTIMQQVNFYPRPPRGGRQIIRHTGNDGLRISIHALREEGDASAG